MSSIDLIPLPVEIHNEVVAQQTEMDWPENVPRFVEFKRDGKELWTEYLRTSVADCTQIVEYHQIEAWRAIAKWGDKKKPSLRRKAAYHILRARLLKLRQLRLMGVADDDINPEDLPFPQLTRNT